MARGANPYYADAGRYTPINQGLSNLGQMFMASQDPSRRASALSSAWDARRNREEVTDIVGAREGRGSLGELFSGYDPEQGLSAGDVIGTAVRSGAMNPDDLGALFQVATGNLPGMSDEQRAGAFVGAGNAIQPSDAFSIAGRDAVADRDQGYAMDLQGLEGDQSMAELRYETEFDRDNPDLSGMTSDEAIAYLFMQDDPARAAQLAETRYGQSRGAGTDPYLQAGRAADLQSDMMNEAVAQLGESGVPTDEEGNLRTDLLPSGLLPSVVDSAWQQMQRDIAAGAGSVRPMSTYVSEAMREQGVEGFDYTEDDQPWWPGGEEALTPREPEEQDASGGDDINVSPGSRIEFPDGRQYSYDDIVQTAEETDMTPAEVVRQLEQEFRGTFVPGS